MKIECLQENLNKGLNIVTHITGKNNTLPILNNILIETLENELKRVSTNLEIGIEANIRCKVIENGKIILPAQLFNNYISTLPQKNIIINSEDNKINISCDDNKFNTKINCLNSDDFPVIPEIEKKNKYVISAKYLKNILPRVINCISLNNTRPEITGVLIKIENNLMFVVGTDGYRLSEGIIKIENEINTAEQIIIPLATAQEINKILQTVNNNIEIYTSQNQILFIFEDIRLVSRVITGNYPDYKQIIPENFKTDFIINKSEFINVIKNVGLFTDKNINDIKIEIKNKKVIIESKNSETGENTVEIETQINGEDNKINFNYQYLIDGLNNINSEKIRISFFDENNPAIIKPEDEIEKNIYKYILMPIRG